MGGKIDCYLDLASLYSYLAFLELQRNRDLLASHNLKVEYHPVLLGAINAGSGNKPPWTLPAKASYGAHDARRSIARQQQHLTSQSSSPHLLPLPLSISPPKNLMQAAMTVPALRALHHIKQHHPPTTFHATLHYLFHAFWAPPNRDLTTLEGVKGALVEVPAVNSNSNSAGESEGGTGTAGAAGGEGDEKRGGKLFTAEEVEGILRAAQTGEIKDAVKQATQEALERGAFGAPWLWVTDAAGRGEAFLGVIGKFIFILPDLFLRLVLGLEKRMGADE